MTVQREYLSPNDIAELLGVSPFTIRRYIKLGELRAVKLLGGFRVHRDELRRFLKAHEVNPAEEELLPEEAPADKIEPAPLPLKAAPAAPRPVAPPAPLRNAPARRNRATKTRRRPASRSAKTED